MRPAKLNLPIRWHSLEEIAEAWGCTVENLHVMATAGDLELTPWMVEGVERIGITAEERRRIEGDHGEAREHPGKVQTLEWLFGCLLMVWSGEQDEFIDHPYVMRAQLIKDAIDVFDLRPPSGEGLKVFRTNETDAKIIRGALATFKGSGLYRPKRIRERERVMAEEKAAEAMRRQNLADRITTMRADRDEAA